MRNESIGVVIPTLGRRPNWLAHTIRSITSANVCIVVVTTSDADVDIPLGVSKVVRRAVREGDLPAAINAGVATLPNSVRFVTWLNDDDVLAPGALHFGMDALEKNPRSPFVFGIGNYVDEHLNLIWRSRFGRLASLTQSIGPNLVPQPGTLIRRSAWDQVDGLDESLTLAFDLDLFLRLRRVGQPLHDSRIESLIRWHDDSMSNRLRINQGREAEHVRRRNSSGIKGRVNHVLAPYFRWLTLRGPQLVLRRRTGSIADNHKSTPSIPL